jgi:hypothetical protein
MTVEDGQWRFIQVYKEKALLLLDSSSFPLIVLQNLHISTFIYVNITQCRIEFFFVYGSKEIA